MSSLRPISSLRIPRQFDVRLASSGTTQGRSSRCCDRIWRSTDALQQERRKRAADSVVENEHQVEIAFRDVAE
jgi:hypothetical protein